MVDLYITTQDWRLDLLAKHLMGSANHGNVEALLNANAGLSAKGQFIAAGTRLIVPKPQAAKPVSAVNPWE
jgi:phage tail protein X